MIRALQRVSGGLLATIVPLGCFAAVLVIGVPGVLVGASGASVPTLPALISAALGLILLLAWSRPGRAARVLASTVVLVLVAVPLASGWASGRNAGSQIAGLLPYSDANGYYHCARWLAEGESLGSSLYPDFCGRRPMFTSAFAGLLVLTGQHLRRTLALLVLLNALACYLAAREVRRSLGAGAATLFLMILLSFYVRFGGTTLTEQLGVSLGAGGFAGLWRGARTGAKGPMLAGLFLLTLALNARAGAFLALPLLVAWISRRSQPSRSRWLAAGLGTAVVVLGFGLNGALARALGAPPSLFSNFSYTLYGLVFGGDWTLVFRDHPEVIAIPPPEHNRQIMRLALDGIAEAPLRLVTGSLRAWRAFLGTEYPFSFAVLGTANLGLRLLTALGLLLCLRRLREPLPSLLLATTLGVLASVPFIPPWDADGMRVYAATIPFLAVAPVVGLFPILRRMAPSFARPPSDEPDSPAPLYWLGGGLVALTFVFPLLWSALPPRPVFAVPSPPSCPQLVYVRVPRGAMVTVVPDGTRTRYPDVVAEGEFRRTLPRIGRHSPILAEALSRLSAPFVLFDALGLQGPRYVFVAAPLDIVPAHTPRKAFWMICGDVGPNPQARQHSFLLARSITPVRAAAR